MVFSSQDSKDYSLDHLAKAIISHKYVVAELLKGILPEEFFGLSDREIVEKYIDTSVLNHFRTELKTQEVDLQEGKKTRYDLHFDVRTPSNKTVVIILEIQRQNSQDVAVRALVYPSKVIAEQNKEYQDFLQVVSTWINLEPPEKLKNTIVLSKMTPFLIEIEKDGFSIEPMKNYESPFNLIRIVEFNVGGPKYKNFNGIIKLLYDLFHNKQEEVKKYFSEQEKIDFNINEVLKPMNDYYTLDESTERFYKEEIKKARAEVRAEDKAKMEEAVAKALKKSKDDIYARMIKNGCSEKFANKIAYGIE